MCEYCGCRGVPSIAELMDEHAALVDEAHHIRQSLSSGNPTDALSRLTRLVEHLGLHVRREEDGIFRALRDVGEFVDEIDALEDEHRGLEKAIAGLTIDLPDFGERVTRLLHDLDVHVEREDLGIFPVSAITLGATGWGIVDRAHAGSPSFLHQAT